MSILSSMPRPPQSIAGEEDDPMSALAKLLGASPELGADNLGPSSGVPFASGGNRNNAVAGALTGKYGLGPDKGEYSQTDLQALDDLVRGKDVADKTAVATAPEKVRGEYGLQAGQQAGQNAQELERLKGSYALQGEREKAAAAVQQAKIKADNPFESGAGGGSSEVDFWTKAAQDSPNGYSVLASIKNPHLLEAVQSNLAAGGKAPQKLSNQTQQMGEAASAILDQAPRVLDLGEKLNQAGLFHPVIGSIRQFAAQHGAGSLLGVDPQTSSDITDFNTSMGLLQSGIARAHAGARGAGNSEIAKRFEQLLNANGDYPSFIGAMRGMSGFMGQYQQALHNGANPDDPHDPLLKQLEMQLRQEQGGGQPQQGADLGAGWGR